MYILAAFIFISVIVGALGGRFFYTMKGRNPRNGIVLGALFGFLPPLLCLFFIGVIIAPGRGQRRASEMMNGTERVPWHDPDALLQHRLQMIRTMYDRNMIDEADFEQLKQNVLADVVAT